jgi:hypothetical protein
VSTGLRRRMRQDGRELEHLPIEDLKALLLELGQVADNPERWTWRYEEWTTFEAALLECECRAEEAEEDRLIALHKNAQVLREDRSAETDGTRVWWDWLPSRGREFFLARLPVTLTEEDRTVVARRCHARPIERERASRRRENEGCMRQLS